MSAWLHSAEYRNADDQCPWIGLFSVFLFCSTSVLGRGLHLPYFRFDMNIFAYDTCPISSHFNIWTFIAIKPDWISLSIMRTRHWPVYIYTSGEFQRSFGQNTRFWSSCDQATKWDCLVVFRPIQSVKIRPIPRPISAGDSIEIPVKVQPKYFLQWSG